MVKVCWQWKSLFFTDGLCENRNFPPITPDLNLVIDTTVSDDYRELYRLFYPIKHI